MKPERLIAIVILFCLCSGVTYARSLKIDAGGSFRYGWWEPSWNNGKYVFYLYGLPYTMPIGAKYKVFSTPYYGARVGIQFTERLQLNSSFHYGTFNGRKKSNISLNVGGEPAPSLYMFTLDLKHYDIDSSFEITLIESIQFFLGFRAAIDVSNNDFDVLTLKSDSELFFVRTKVQKGRYIPSLGLHFTAPLYDTLSLSFTTAASYCIGYDILKSFKGFDPSGNVMYPPLTYPEGRFSALGGWARVRLNYMIEPVMTTLSINFTYNYMNYSQKKNDTSSSVQSGPDSEYYLAFSCYHTITITPSKEKLWMPHPNEK